MGEPKSTQLAVRHVFKNDASLQRNLKKKKLIRNVSLPIGREKFIVTVGRLLFWKNIAAEEAVPKERAVLSANTSGCTRPAAARAPGCSPPKPATPHHTSLKTCSILLLLFFLIHSISI